MAQTAVTRTDQIMEIGLSGAGERGARHRHKPYTDPFRRETHTHTQTHTPPHTDPFHRETHTHTLRGMHTLRERHTLRETDTQRHTHPKRNTHRH